MVLEQRLFISSRRLCNPKYDLAADVHGAEADSKMWQCELVWYLVFNNIYHTPHLLIPLAAPIDADLVGAELPAVRPSRGQRGRHISCSSLYDFFSTITHSIGMVLEENAAPNVEFVLGWILSCEALED